MNISKVLNKNKKILQSNLNFNSDIIFRDLLIGDKNMLIVYVQDIVDANLLSQGVIMPLTKLSSLKNITINKIKEKIITIGGVETLEQVEDCLKEVLEGNAVLFAEGQTKALKLNVSKPDKRSIIEPPTSAVIYGPREGFVESLSTNTTLIRKRLKTTALKIEQLSIGRYTKTKVRLFYLDDIADLYVVKKIKERLEKIEIDGIIDSHYLVSFLEERKNSIFKQVGKTEKPDILTAKILEGRIGIMIDGSPIALTVPYILLEDIQSSDDYYQKSFRVSLIRIVRLFGIIFSIILPGLYVAIQTMHYRIVPIKFLITLMDSIQGLPFTPMLEMLFVILLFEILYESSLRMPKYLGMALGIVGALILGDTAVKAGLISPPAVMLVALSGISFYTIPDSAAQLSVLRIVFTLAGGIFGIMGMSLMFLFLISYMCDLNAFDSPYLAPFAPNIKRDLRDGIIKRETLALKTYPRSIPNQKKNRLDRERFIKG